MSGAGQSSSSRRAKKRIAQITPPPTTSDGKKESDTQAKANENSSNFRSSIIPPKAPKSEGIKSDVQKTSKIASMFERQKENNNSGTNLNRNPVIRNQSASNVVMAQNKPKTLDLKPKAAPAPAPPKTQVIEVFEYDPMLGYCTVKRKTVPITEGPASAGADNNVQSPSVSANLSFLQSPTQPPPTPSKPDTATEAEQPAFKEKPEEPQQEKDKSISTQEQDNSEIISQGNEKSVDENENDIPTSSGTSSKENKVPNNQTKKASGAPLVPLTGMSKYDDIPFPWIFGQKTIPEPPKSKPPKLPKSVNSKLPMPKMNNASAPATSTETGKKETPAPVQAAPAPTEIKVEIEEDTKVNVKVTKPPEKTEESTTRKESKEKKSSDSKGANEAKEWYWDYDEECWKECDPDEEYEWEYIDDEDEDKNKSTNEEIQATVKLSDKSKSQQNTLESSKDVKNSADSVTKKDRKADLPKDESKIINIFELAHLRVRPITCNCIEMPMFRF